MDGRAQDTRGVPRARRASGDGDLRAPAGLRTRSGDLVGYFALSEIVRRSFLNAVVGYYAAAALAGRGLMSEAMLDVLAHAFDELGLHRVEANVQPANARSLALVARCGMRREGFSPRLLNIGGVWCDHERWAITVEDWRETPK
jgi:ribosomal-protein-alanine N-acetyltransferase